MAKSDKKKSGPRDVSDKQRFRYIGFEVFPGKPRDLFKSEAEKDKLVDALRKKRQSGQIIRDDCTLLEKRVSASDRIVMAVAALAMLASLFIPWFAVYNEIEEQVQIKPAAAEVADSAVALDDSTMLAMETDSLGQAVATLEGEEPPVETPTAEPVTTDEVVDAEAVPEEGGPEVASTLQGQTEEVIHGYIAKKKIYKEYSRLTGLGAFASLGSVGSYVFSSGFILMLTGVIFLLMVLASVGLPALTLYGLFGLKGDDDQQALKLKKLLRLNWLPLGMFIATMALSFVGASYGFNSEQLFDSLDNAYGAGVFLNSLSWGAFVCLAASIMLAVKGIEI